LDSIAYFLRKVNSPTHQFASSPTRQLLLVQQKKEMMRPPSLRIKKRVIKTLVLEEIQQKKKITNHRISGLASVRDRLSIQTITLSMQTRCGDEARAA
jgi:hypothetical protein